MLNLREVEEQNHYLNTLKSGRDVTLVDKFENAANFQDHSVTSDTGDEVLKTFKSRPRRLPPLIDALVGTLDSDYEAIHSKHGHGWRGQRKLVRRMDMDDREKLGEITKKGLRDMSLGEDPVAMVAVAAAAALWSEHNDRGGSPLRMKVVNDEWEEALRWISSWGDQNVQSSIESTAHQERITDIETENEGVQRKPRRKYNPNDRQSRMNRFKAENEIDFERFYDVCIDRCLGDDGVNRSRGHKTGETFDITTNTLNVESTSSGVNQLFSTLMSSIKVVGSKNSIFKERTHVKTVWGLFGIMLSTVGVWLRNLIDRRKQSSCYHSLLKEEDARMAGTNTSGTKHRNSGGKKTGSKKKSKRKRRDTRSNQKQDHGNLTSRFDEESVTSEVSLERSESEAIFVKSFGDQGSKEGNTTVSTLNTDEAEFEDQSNSGLVSTSQPSRTKPKANNATNQQRNGFSPTKHRAKGQSTRRCQDHHFKQSKPLRSTQKDCLPDNNKRYSLKSPTLVAPTTEQREEAARKLKAFQQSQIQKMMNLSRRKVQLETKVDDISTVEQVSSEDAHTVNLNFDEAKVVVSPPPPPPGLTRITNIQVQKQYDEHMQEENDASLLVSNLLDEDDEDLQTSNDLSLTAERINSMQNSQIQPVPFGDLLVGSYSTINASNGTSIANPWRDELLDCSTVTTQVSTPSHTSMQNANSLASISSDILCPKDANFCLQVSAPAFSPTVKSNGIEGETEQKTKIW